MEVDKLLFMKDKPVWLIQVILAPILGHPVRNVGTWKAGLLPKYSKVN